MKSWRQGTVIIIALAAPAQLAVAVIELNCLTSKVMIRDAPGESRSIRTVEYLDFLVDDVAKTLAFKDGRPLQIRRFDHSWISAERDDIRYEFNRSDGTLTYAGSIAEDSTATTIVGSGHCEPYHAPSSQ
jgi:hypothetical protein